MIRKLAEVLRRRMMWHGCTDKSCAGGVSYHGWIFGWYIGAWGMI